MRRMHDRDTEHSKVGLNEVKNTEVDLKAEVEDVLTELKESEK